MAINYFQGTVPGAALLDAEDEEVKDEEGEADSLSFLL